MNISHETKYSKSQTLTWCLSVSWFFGSICSSSADGSIFCHRNHQSVERITGRATALHSPRCQSEQIGRNSGDSRERHKNTRNSRVSFKHPNNKIWRYQDVPGNLWMLSLTELSHFLWFHLCLFALDSWTDWAATPNLSLTFSPPLLAKSRGKKLNSNPYF